jgi:RNA polymerase-binding protein DksA
MKPEQKQSEDLCRQLKDRREKLYTRIRALRSAHDEAASIPGDTMDNAKSSVDLDIRTNLIDSAEQELLHINSALARAVSGEYGICVGCREPIPLARLEAVPFTVYCVDCASTRTTSASLTAPSERAMFKNWTPPLEADESQRMRNNGADVIEGDVAKNSPSLDDDFACGPEADERHTTR